MKKLLQNITTPVRLSVLATFLLALFVTPWVVFGIFQLRDNVQLDAKCSIYFRIDSINNVLTLRDYNRNNMPSADTPEYDRLRADLSMTMFADMPYIIRYSDASFKPVYLRSGLLMTCADEKGRDVQYDFSGFSEDDLRALHEVLLPLSSDDSKDTASALAVPIDFYGKKASTAHVTLFTLNRIAIDGKEWTAQTPLKETDETHAQVKTVSWPFKSDKALETYLSEIRSLEYQCQLAYVDFSDTELSVPPSSPNFVTASSEIPYGSGEVLGACSINWTQEYQDGLSRIAVRCVCMYVLVLIIFYKCSKRMLSRSENR